VREEVLVCQRLATGTAAPVKLCRLASRRVGMLTVRDATALLLIASGAASGLADKL
jgi:hypothetical protein